MNNLKDTIREHRIKNNLSQQELADVIGCESPSTISMWESGDRTPPTAKIPLLARALGISCDELLLGRSTPSQSQKSSGARQ